ncbi:unnamed protein product [Brachionus calyciflorus]|uniref:Uncharacterized protein n=1 Tax=Brachionus calyciflorus TaxID=104777 RepID=A0A814H516_9BILA|nr:unnamed protein product [Brachionus calyciflorus]
MRGVSRSYLNSYLDEFCWRHNMAQNRSEVAEAILDVMASEYSDDLSNAFEQLSTKSDDIDEVDKDFLEVESVSDERSIFELPLYDVLVTQSKDVSNNRKNTTNLLLEATNNTPIANQNVIETINKVKSPKKRGRKPKSSQEAANNDGINCFN